MVSPPSTARFSTPPARAAFGSETREPGDAMVVLRYQAFAFQGLSNDRRGFARLSMNRAG